jgi:hypothetical protein
MKKTTVITFPCNNYIHVYTEKSGLIPRLPYKSHNSIKDAKKYLKETRNISDIKVIEK